MAQVFNYPTLKADINQIKGIGAAAQSVDFKGLAEKLNGLLPENGPIVTQSAQTYGYPYVNFGYPDPYALTPYVVNTKYGKIESFSKQFLRFSDSIPFVHRVGIETRF